MRDCYDEYMEPRFVDINGNPVKTTPFDSPYGYDNYVLFKSENYNDDDSWVYDDRMAQWDYEKFSKAVQEVSNGACLGQFSRWKPEQIEKFLQIYFGEDVELTAVMQGCNFSSGNPLWIFAYHTKQSIKGEIK